MIKLIIFDLDNTLFDTYNQVGRLVLEDMIVHMREAGLTLMQERTLRKKYAYTGFRIISKQLKFNLKIVKIGMQASKYMNLSKITPYPDVKLLGDFKQKLILVTSGVERIQQSKVDILNLRKYFSEVIIDISSSIDNKRIIFNKILKKYSVKPQEVIVVGDNPESEITAGNKLDMITVQIRRRPGMIKGSAKHYIKGLNELTGIIKKYS